MDGKRPRSFTDAPPSAWKRPCRDMPQDERCDQACEDGKSENLNDSHCRVVPIRVREVGPGELRKACPSERSALQGNSLCHHYFFPWVLYLCPRIACLPYATYLARSLGARWISIRVLIPTCIEYSTPTAYA